MNYQNREKRLPTKEEREAKKEQNRKDAEQTTHSVPISSGSRQNDSPVRLLENHSAFCWKANSRDERHPDRSGRVSDDVAPVQFISSLCKTKPSFVVMASAPNRSRQSLNLAY
jgi:hypothetical protein